MEDNKDTKQYGPEQTDNISDREKIINKDQDTHINDPLMNDPPINDQPIEEIKTVSENLHDGKMRIKCVKCGIVDDLNEDDIKLLGYIVKRYNQKANPVDYVAVLSVIKGLCTDGDKHLFVFDESFEKNVADTIKEYEDAIKHNVERKIALDKVCHQIKETSDALKEIVKKKEYILAEMAAGGMLIENLRLKFLKLTGTEDMEIWE